MEPGEKGQVCGKLNNSLYGTRGAASNWEDHYSKVLVALGFRRGLSSPCLFFHEACNIETVVHGDDFTSLGPHRELKWFAHALSKYLSIKERGILGPEVNDMKEIRILNRIVAWEPDGIRYEADQRHAEVLVKALNLQDAKGVETPGTQMSVDAAMQAREQGTPLSNAEATAYRACAARCNCLGLDRPDIQYAAKEISRYMSKPQEEDIAALKRLARYVKQYPRVAFKFKFQSPPSKIRVYSDSNYAGCLKTRKSTQGGIVMLGNHCIKTYSSTQSIIAISSAEAEFYGIVKAASVGLGIQSSLKDLGSHLSLQMYTDASAAQAMASRRGLGKVKHMDVQYLWVQERINQGDISISKVPGTENPADLLTKHLSKDVIHKYMSIIGLHVLSGRSAIAPSLGHLSLRGSGALSALSANLRPPPKRACCNAGHQFAGKQATAGNPITLRRHGHYEACCA